MKSLLHIMALMLFGVALSAQGTVSGKVYDKESSEGLIAAFVEVVGTEIIESTDFDGNYVLTLPDGTHSIKVTYIGYQDKIVEEVIVTKGSSDILDIAMGTDLEVLTEVVVTARAVKNTENYVLLERKKSDKIQDGIGRQELKRLGVSNVASAMTKVTGTSVTDGKYVYVRGLGDRYSVTQLNGMNLPSIDPYRNSAQLDLIPANLVENLIVNKTFTPDLPGTFTGGLLDIKTKDYPEAETFSVSVSASYNDQTTGNGDFLTFTDEGANTDWLGYGTKARAIPDVLQDPNIQSTLNRDAPILMQWGRLSPEATQEFVNGIDDASNALDYNFQAQRQAPTYNHGISLSYGNTYNLGKMDLGLILSAGYKKNYRHVGDRNLELDNNTGSLIGNWELQSTSVDHLINRGKYVQQRSTETPIVNGLAGLALKINELNSIDFKVMYNHNATKQARLLWGENGQDIENGRFKRSSNLSFIEREMLNLQLSGKHVLSNVNNLEVTWNMSKVSSSLDAPRLRYFNSQVDVNTGIEEIPLSNLNRPFYFWRDLNDDIYNGKVDIKLPFDFFGRDGASFKVGYNYSDKTRIFTEDRYIVESPTESGIAFRGSFEEFFNEQNYGIIGVETYQNFTNYQLGIYPEFASVLENSYDGQATVHGAYGMTTLPISSRLKLIAGARMEITSIGIQSADTSLSSLLESTDILPSANLIYNLGNNMNLRASYSRTIARPSLREIAPYCTFDPDLDVFYCGNPELVTTNISNYDLRWEWFFAPGEIIAVSAYHKSFDNPITLQYRPSTNLELQYVNVPTGEVSGIELEFRKNLSFIGSALENFKIGANMTLLDSRMDAPEDRAASSVTERPFEGQSDILLNGSLSYVNRDLGLNATMSLGHFGDRLNNISRDGTPDIFEQGRTTLDFVASKKLGRFSVGISGKNLLNAVYQTSSTYRGNEYIYERYTIGREFGMSLSYTM